MREIKLSAGLSLYDIRTAFPIGDLELYISGLPDSINAEFRLVAFNNDSKIGEYTLNRNNPYITIPREKLSAGVFSCRVLHFQGDTVVHRYTVENLIISDIDDTLSATPEIVALNAKTDELTAKTEELEEALSEAKTEVEEAATKADEAIKAMLALIKWAYGVENAVPYLDGGDIKAFADKLGITLTEEQKNYITGGNNND